MTTTTLQQLYGADLGGAGLRGAILCDCNLDGATITYRAGNRQIRKEKGHVSDNPVA